MPSDFYDVFSLKFVEDISVQDNYQQLQGKFIAQNFYEDQDARDSRTIDVGSNTIFSFFNFSNASSSDQIATLNLKRENGSGSRLQHYPVPFSGLKNEDFNISTAANFLQGKFVHLEKKEHEFTINIEVIGHYFYDHIATYLEDFISFNPLSCFPSKYGVHFQSKLSFHFQFFFSQRKFNKYG